MVATTLPTTSPPRVAASEAGLDFLAEIALCEGFYNAANFAKSLFAGGEDYVQNHLTARAQLGEAFFAAGVTFSPNSCLTDEIRPELRLAATTFPIPLRQKFCVTN